MRDLRRYMIAEESSGAGLALVAAALGIVGLAHISNRKAIAKNKMKRDELNQWLEKNHVGTSDAAIKAFVDKKLLEIARDADTLIKKVYSNSKFRSNFESTVKAKVDAIHSEYSNDENREYFEIRINWSIYSPGCMKLGTKIWGPPKRRTYEVAMIDPNSKLYNAILDNEDGDDNAPEFLNRILAPTLDDVGKGVVAKLGEMHADILASGLVKIEYHDCWESYYDLLPEIYIAASDVPSKDGKNRNIFR